MALPNNIVIGGEYLFAYPEQFTTLPDYSSHRGQIVQVLRPLTQEEADQGDGMERMFKVRAKDGWEGDAFASELRIAPPIVTIP